MQKQDVLLVAMLYCFYDNFWMKCGEFSSEILVWSSLVTNYLWRHSYRKKSILNWLLPKERGSLFLFRSNLLSKKASSKTRSICFADVWMCTFRMLSSSIIVWKALGMGGVTRVFYGCSKCFLYLPVKFQNLGVYEHECPSSEHLFLINMSSFIEQKLWI